LWRPRLSPWLGLVCWTTGRSSGFGVPDLPRLVLLGRTAGHFPGPVTATCAAVGPALPGGRVSVGTPPPSLSWSGLRGMSCRHGPVRCRMVCTGLCGLYCTDRTVGARLICAYRPGRVYKDSFNAVGEEIEMCWTELDQDRTEQLITVL